MFRSFPSPLAVPFAAHLAALAALCFWPRAFCLSNADFLPHWYCLAGDSRRLWTTVLADLFIGLSYVVISATLIRIVLRAAAAQSFIAKSSRCNLRFRCSSCPVTPKACWKCNSHQAPSS